jgi:hypothetical protein
LFERPLKGKNSALFKVKPTNFLLPQTDVLLFPPLNYIRSLKEKEFRYRKSEIPNSFSSSESYFNSMRLALIEILNIQIFSLSKKISALSSIKNITNIGFLLYYPSSLYSTCKSNLSGLKIVNEDFRSSNTKNFAKDDLWVISTSSEFSSSSTFLARSTWHSASQDSLEINIVNVGLTKNPPEHTVALNILDKKVYALRLGNFSTDFIVLDTILEMQRHILELGDSFLIYNFPLLKSICFPDCKVGPLIVNDHPVGHIALNSIELEEYNLNTDQQRFFII